MPLAGGDAAWFKACAPVQAFEPRLTAALSRRWPDRVVEVIAHDEERAWLLLADAGTPIQALGDALGAWPAALPRYAELQRGEAAHAGAHLADGVPDLRLEALPARSPPAMPLEPEERAALRAFAPRFGSAGSPTRSPGCRRHDDLPDGPERTAFLREFRNVLRLAYSAAA